MPAGHRGGVSPRALSSAAPGHGDALSALLATEQALRARLDVARAESERLLAEARERAARWTRELEGETARVLAALDTERAAALKQEIAESEARARADRARFEGVSEERVQALAARALEIVLAA